MSSASSPYLNSYNIVSSCAIKEKSMGRASGGLAIFIHKSFDYKVLEIAPWWIICLISWKHYKFVVCSVYFKPSFVVNEFKYLLETLKKCLTGILDKFNCIPFIIGGDFNSRISDLNLIPVDVLEGANLFESRLSSDIVINSRGKYLLDLMSINSLSVVNGRSPGDWPGQFTHISSLGNSVIDLVWPVLPPVLFLTSYVNLNVTMDYQLSSCLGNEVYGCAGKSPN